MEDRQLEHHEVRTKKQKFPLSIIAHNIERPANVGSIFRIADGLGIEKVYLSGSTPVPPNRKITKTSRATEKVVLYEYVQDSIETIKDLKHNGYTVVSLEITNDSIDIDEFCKQQFDKIALIVGSENKGVNQELLKASDHVIHIPMYGENTSLNVASVCAIAIFQMNKCLL